ncbi:MAG: hypothetical protein AAFX44_18980 [Pseudomonadota bacterium]
MDDTQRANVGTGSYEDEWDLIKVLREEAAEMKECFTRYSFQTISISVAALGVILSTQLTKPTVGWISVPLVLLVLAVMRIGIYKFTGAHRLYGFQLHLARLKHIKDDALEFRRELMLGINWEEAMRAWRVVQSTIFRTLYSVQPTKTIRFIGSTPTLKPEYKQDQSESNTWFRVSSLIDNDASFYAGSYMRTMFSILISIIGVSLLLLFVMVGQEIANVWPTIETAYQSFGAGKLDLTSFLWDLKYPIFTALVAAGFAVASIRRVLQITARRHMLEDGVHSIHSCAIAWQLVTIAHFRALRDLGADNAGNGMSSLSGYSRALSEQAVDLATFLHPKSSIYTWLEPKNPA